MPDPAPSRPPGRYDDRDGRPRRGTVAVIVIVGCAFGAWVLWAALGAASPDVRSEVQGFEVTSGRRVSVDLQVSADSRRPVSCTLQAQDRDHEPVGQARVTLPPGAQGTRSATVVVRTRSRAVTAVVLGCRLGRATG